MIHSTAYMHALAQARAAKERSMDAGVRVHESASQWFVKPPGAYTKSVTYDCIAAHADKEYMEWCTPHPDITHTFDLDAKLTSWIEQIDIDDLARLIMRTPRGLSADPNTGISFDFTPWQRISMEFYIHPFFSVTSRVIITAETIWNLCEYREEDRGRARRIPITCEMSCNAQGMRDVGIINFPTASGKTSWVMAVALLLLMMHNFSTVCGEHVQKLTGAMFKGPCTPKVARMVIIAAAGSTFHHFKTTVERLIPRFVEMDPDVRIIVWSTLGALHSTQVAYEMPQNVVVVWIVPPSKLNAVLRQHPDVTVPVCVIDEYTQDTPRERYETERSHVLKHMVAQATPQALTDATRGNRSWLRDVFRGPLSAPRSIHRSLRHRAFNDATLTTRQLCMLDLTTMTPFGHRIRNDLVLASLVPSLLNVTFIPSRRRTVVSHILDSSADIVPASLCNTILAYLRPFDLDDISRTRITSLLNDGSRVVPADITQTLDEATSRLPAERVDSNIITRLKERILDFTNSCPICMDEAPDMHVMGCCGYCLCTDCYRQSRDTRCAFCRTQIRTTLTRADLDSEDVVTERNAAVARVLVEESYPIRESPAPPLVPEDMHRNSQLTNLTRTLQHMPAHCNRILIVVERLNYSSDLSVAIDIPTLSERTGVRIVRVDELLNGQGSKFNKIKAEFDSPNPAPMALLSFGMNEKFLAGTDLGRATAFIAVGRIDGNILVQCIGRIFRPVVGRVPDVPVTLYSIYSRAQNE